MSGEFEQHKLNRNWTLWYDSPTTYNSGNWELSLVPVMTVHSVEEFFVMLEYMKPLHSLRTSAQYHFFQENIKPMWEDEANKKGGKIWVNIDINKNEVVDPASDVKTDLDKMWENTLMSIIGEYLEDETDEDGEPHILGVVIAKKKYYNRLAIWVRDASCEKAVELIKKKLVSEACIPASLTLTFTPHGEKS